VVRRGRAVDHHEPTIQIFIGTDAKYIYVIFEDVAPSNWAGEGKLFGPPDNGAK